MNDIFVAFVTFVAAFLLQAVIHRVLIFFGKRSLLSLGVYPLSWVGLIGYFFTRQSVLPFTSLLFFGLLTCVYTILFLSIYLHQNSPSTKMYVLIRKNRSMSIKDILKHFSEEEMIAPRLADLARTGYISKQKGIYRVLSSGKKVDKYLSFYRKLLKWESSG